ncbi:MAG TPA: ABC transporter ATP-binding protein [Candidatus Paceibacterota bacterium]|nr:ABC transporter ATP-binding protein [Candidatus Paceibacterota bacterium]
MDSIIKIENVNLWYEKGKSTEVHALNNVNIEITRGDYVAFFGPSGCGKTTMLYAISGIDRFQEGSIAINGHDISTLTNQELAMFRQTGIGIVFQQFNLVPSLNILKNVALPMLFVGITSEKAEIEAMKLLVRLNIAEYADRYPNELSGGQQQRVGIARALANDPPIIIADEPLGNLDSANAQNVLKFLRELNEKDGRTIIMVTHEAWSLRDVKTIFHMKDGVITDEERVENKNVAESLSKNLYKQLSGGSDHATEEKMSARLLANFLLRGYSMDEINRFEILVGERFENKITKAEFKVKINRPFKDGGVGLWKKKSERVTEYIESVIERREDIHHVHNIIEKSPELPIKEEIHHIRKWIVEDYAGKLSDMQVIAIEEVIADRLKGSIDSGKVAEVLNLSVKKFGAGLSFRAAKLISEKLEILLGEEVPEAEEETKKDTDSSENSLKKL